MNRSKITETLIRLFAFITGILIFLVLAKNISLNLLESFSWIYEKVGVTVIALIPLAVWSIWVAFRNHSGNDLTLAYIGTTAQRVGLLGTVIGIVMATIRIGDNLANGAAGAVTGALPAVGQALLSTAVGFVIALVCDFFRYLNTKSIKNDATQV